MCRSRRRLRLTSRDKSVNMRRPLPYPALCLVTDRRICPADELPGRVASAIAGGVDVVQLRDKDLPGGALLELASALRAVCAGRALLLVNERVDVAVAAGADGVQLGEVGLPTPQARVVMGNAAGGNAGIIGRSVHSVDGARMAAADGGADFLLVGTMFATGSHPGEEPSGPGLLRRIADAGVRLPLLGIGGITADNVGAVLDAGAYGAAVITSVLGSADPESAARRLKGAMLDAIAAGPDAGQYRHYARQSATARQPATAWQEEGASV